MIQTNLTLRIVEISWNGDDSVLHLGAQVRLSSFLHFNEHECANLRR